MGNPAALQTAHGRLPGLEYFLCYSKMMHAQPLIAVTDVEASSRWYQRLLGCQSAHGGAEYERLVANDVLVLQLHSFDVEHHHGLIGNPDDKPYGNGVLLWFEIDDFDAAVARAEEMSAEILRPRHRNPPTGIGGPNHWECWLRDPDGYTVVLASPDGSAG
jgi:catechol 2,3-dioxygenase-like lactoylglutathione lyase family enzyme